MVHDVIYNLNIVVSSVLVTVAILFALLFYKEWKKQKRTENEQYIPLALMLFYGGISVGFIMMTNSNFFIDPELFALYLQVKSYQFTVLTACVFTIGIFVYIAERIIRINTKHIFLIYFCIIAALFYLFKIYDIPNLEYYIILLIPIGILISLFAYHLIWKSSGQIRQKMLIVTVGYITFIVAIVLVVRFILFIEYTVPFELNKYVIPLEVKSLVLLASILAGYGFYAIPSFTEFDWKDKINSLYLISSSGICLFQQNFKSVHIKDEDLFGGGLVAMQALIQEMIQSDKALRVIDHEDLKIIFERSFLSKVLVIMIAEEDLFTVHEKLQQFLKEFDLLFGDVIQEWRGDLNIFKPLEPIVNRIFEL
ncbi:MAG: hypothetical protein ACFFD2_26310 [Promethearchaeota archaeon]